MSIFKDIKNWIEDRKMRKEIDEMVDLLSDSGSLYRSCALSDENFVYGVANYFSLMYNDLHFSNFDEKKHEQFSEMVTEWTKNFIEAEEMRLDDVKNKISHIEQLFSETGIDIYKRLYFDDCGQMLTDLVETAHLIERTENTYNQLDYHSFNMLENNIKGDMALVQCLAQAITSGKLRRDGMPFVRGEVVPIKLENFEEYEACIDEFVNETELPKNATDEQIIKAMEAYETFYGETFCVENYVNLDESFKHVDSDNFLDVTHKIFDIIHESYMEYQEELHYLDIYKDVTVYDTMLVPNVALLTYMVDPIMMLVPSEFDSLFSLLDDTDSKITIDKKYSGHYTRYLKECEISQDDANMYFTVMDDNLRESEIDYNNLENKEKNNADTKTKSSSKQIDGR